MNPKIKLSDYQLNAINRGFPWECACGELHRSYEGARGCRKCRQYLIDIDDRPDPVDLRTL